ncbi:hypothetical protein WR25_22146 [Diploscapter pachys]|uniref:Uncharacterized protein n=1 Tax=Diploscapter pachys TaxID=2018661 RepID=A0A2A2M253_9BILA|nr:hypothetical protein WR25_22146 [Diploscapter pachys]
MRRTTSRSSPSAASSRIDTSAKARGGRVAVPAKMTSSIPAPRSDLALDSPIVQRSASSRLDLPQPFGPTTPVSPGSIWRSAGSTKLLNPAMRSRLICTRVGWRLCEGGASFGQKRGFTRRRGDAEVSGLAPQAVWFSGRSTRFEVGWREAAAPRLRHLRVSASPRDTLLDLLRARGLEQRFELTPTADVGLLAVDEERRRAGDGAVGALVLCLLGPAVDLAHVAEALHRLGFGDAALLGEVDQAHLLRHHLDRVDGLGGLQLLLLRGRHRLELVEEAFLRLVHLFEDREEGGLVGAIAEQRRRHVGCAVDQELPVFEADLAALHIVHQRFEAVAREGAADRAQARAIFDDLDRRVRVADDRAFRGARDDVGPVLARRCGDGGDGAGGRGGGAGAILRTGVERQRQDEQSGGEAGLHGVTLHHENHLRPLVRSTGARVFQSPGGCSVPST